MVSATSGSAGPRQLLCPSGKCPRRPPETARFGREGGEFRPDPLGELAERRVVVGGEVQDVVVEPDGAGEAVGEGRDRAEDAAERLVVDVAGGGEGEEHGDVRGGAESGARVEPQPMRGDGRFGLGHGDDQAGPGEALGHAAEGRRRVTPDRAIPAG
jgi:hypothetical protein